jgi:hypothetical protein
MGIHHKPIEVLLPVVFNSRTGRDNSRDDEFRHVEEKTTLQHATAFFQEISSVYIHVPLHGNSSKLSTMRTGKTLVVKLLILDARYWMLDSISSSIQKPVSRIVLIVPTYLMLFKSFGKKEFLNSNSYKGS